MEERNGEGVEAYHIETRANEVLLAEQKGI